MCARPWAPAPPLSGHPSTHASSSRHLLCLGTDPLPPPGTHPSHAAATGERALLSEEAVKMRCGCRNLWERSPDASLQPPASPAARSFPVCPPHQLDREDTGAETAFRSSLSSGGGGEWLCLASSSHSTDPCTSPGTDGPCACRLEAKDKTGRSSRPAAHLTCCNLSRCLLPKIGTAPTPASQPQSPACLLPELCPPHPPGAGWERTKGAPACTSTGRLPCAGPYARH